MTYDDGTNKVTVTGATNITLKFGDTENAASGMVFEDKNKGFIA